MSRYADTKLLSTMFIDELARKVDNKHVIINDVSPGVVVTNFGASYPWYLKVMFAVTLGPRARRRSEGVKTYLHAVAVAGEDSHGEYLSDNQITT